MEDRDGKKPFIIPKTHTLIKDVFITEKADSRNVIELFNDIKSCALEGQFDFRQNGCKSCDTIRNQKLQKLYNEKRIKMKKDQDPIERLAFHLITYRDVASNVANDGIRCEQLSFPIDKYLGNPKDGVHLSRRPDVLLTSSGAQGLYRFGLLVCKVLLGKGYATIPSTNNNQLPAQLHYDHHFCKIQSINKEQRHIDDLLANSLIFFYEHNNFQTISYPTQILPIAILWYDLIEKFSPELISIINQESQHRNDNGKLLKKKTSNQSKKFLPSILNKSITINSTTLESSIQDTTQNSNSIIKYPNHFMIPYNRIYSNPSINTEQQQQIINSRDPRLLRTKREITSETIPLSPQHLIPERSLSDSLLSIKSLNTSSDELLLITKNTSLIYIPLNSSILLIDPRLKTLKQTRNIFYLELQSVKHALQQQKRLNHYYDIKNGITPKTNYTLIPFLIRQVSINEYERLLNDDNNTYKFTKHSNNIDYSLLYISVIDCFNFGLLKPRKSNQLYIDLEHNENKLAYEQIEISNELIQREKQLNSQQIRLRLREKRQRKIQQEINEKKKFINPLLTNSKLYITNGRQLLKEHQISTISPNKYLSSNLLDFFSQEYKNENRPHVKHLLAELVGIFIEKYHIEHNQTIENHHFIEEPIIDDQTINSVIDMDLDSPSSQGLCDRDERFRIPTPPPLPPPLTLPPLPPTNETIYTPPLTSLILTHTLSNEPNKIFDDQNYNDRYQKLVQQLKEQYKQKDITLSIPKTESIIPTEDVAFKACLEQFESSSSDNSLIDDNHPLTIDDNLQQEPLIQDDSNRSRDEFVKLLTKEAYISKSSSPAKIQNKSKHSYNYHKHRRRSYDDNDNNKNYSHSLNNKIRHKKSSYKKISSTRTVTLISNHSTISNDKQNIEISTNNRNNLQDEPIVKRIKIDSISSSLNTTNELEKDLSLKSIVTVPIITDDHDCRHDLNEKRRTIVSTKNSSRSRSRSKSKDHHRQRSSTNSQIKSLESKNYSRSSRSSSNDNHHQYRHHLSNHHHKQYSNQLSHRHNNIFNETSYQNSLSSTYHQHNMNDLILPENLHHLQQRQPVRHKRFNYNHQSVADHPRFANPNTLPSTTPLMDFNYPKSPIHRRSTSPVTIGDRNVNSSYYQSESTPINYSNCFDIKSSNTFEHLQMILQNKTTFEQSQIDCSVNETVKYSSSSSSINNDNSHWSSSSYSSKTKI